MITAEDLFDAREDVIAALVAGWWDDDDEDVDAEPGDEGWRIATDRDGVLLERFDGLSEADELPAPSSSLLVDSPEEAVARITELGCSARGWLVAGPPDVLSRLTSAGLAARVVYQDCSYRSYEALDGSRHYLPSNISVLEDATEELWVNCQPDGDGWEEIRRDGDVYFVRNVDMLDDPPGALVLGTFHDEESAVRIAADYLDFAEIDERTGVLRPVNSSWSCSLRQQQVEHEDDKPVTEPNIADGILDKIAQFAMEKILQENRQLHVLEDRVERLERRLRDLGEDPTAM